MQRSLEVLQNQIDLHDFYDYELDNGTFNTVKYQDVIKDLIAWGVDKDTIKIMQDKDMIHIQEFGSFIPTSILEENEVNLANKVAQTLA
jgi:hypothetical protein